MAIGNTSLMPSSINININIIIINVIKKDTNIMFNPTEYFCMYLPNIHTDQNNFTYIGHCYF